MSNLKKQQKTEVQYLCIWRSGSRAHTVQSIHTRTSPFLVHSITFSTVLSSLIQFDVVFFIVIRIRTYDQRSDYLTCSGHAEADSVFIPFLIRRLSWTGVWSAINYKYTVENVNFRAEKWIYLSDRLFTRGSNICDARAWDPGPRFPLVRRSHRVQCASHPQRMEIIEWVFWGLIFLCIFLSHHVTFDFDLNHHFWPTQKG